VAREDFGGQARSADARPRLGHRRREPAARGRPQRLPRAERANADAGARLVERHYLPGRGGGPGLHSPPGLQTRLAHVAREGARARARRAAKIAVPAYLDLYRQFDPPFERFGRSMLGAQFAAELDLVSRLWFRCGYRPGIGAYLNFFLLRDFITT